MRISDWSSDVCSSDLDGSRHPSGPAAHIVRIRGRIRGHEPDRRADDRRHADRAVVVDVRPACRLSAASAAENQARARTHFNMKEKTMKHALLTIALGLAALTAACGKKAEPPVAEIGRAQV